MKETLIVIYRSMTVGGIETNMVNIMNNALEKGRRVIWICDKAQRRSNTYDFFFNKGLCEIVPINFSSFNPLNIPPLKFSMNERVLISVFDVSALYFAYKIRKEHREAKIQILYMVPLFTGSTIFPEQSFNGLLKNKVRKHFSKIYKIIDDNDTLYFFAKSFYEALERDYGIVFKEPQKKLIPESDKRIPLNLEEAKQKYNSTDFTIISAGRLEFPHKGFVLGLVRSFALLYEKHPNLKLKIIGDGPDKQVLVDLIASLPADVKCAIELLPPVSKRELTILMQKCNLNISVAGCATQGAMNGVPTLPARHFHEDCEVYGFIPDSKGLTVSETPGQPVEFFIEKALAMSEEEYLNLSYKSYHCYDDINVNLDFPFDKGGDTTYLPSRREVLAFQFIYFRQRVRSLITRILG